MLTDPVLDVVRRELRKLSPDVRIENEQIREVLLSDVLKRDVVEGEKADQAKKKIAKAMNRQAKAKPAKSKDDGTEEATADPTAEKSVTATIETPSTEPPPAA